MTPTPNLQNQKSLLGPKLQIDVFQAWIGQLLDEIFQKKPKPEMAHKTESRSWFAKICRT